MMKTRILSLVTALACLMILPAMAQDNKGASPKPAGAPESKSAAAPAPVTPPAQAPAATTPPPQKFGLNGEDRADAPVFSYERFQSLVFTYWEHAAIMDMKRARGETRAPDEAELQQALKNKQDETKKVKPPPEEREIRLAGIAYNGPADWTIWLNEKRIQPDAIPKEVLDLKVYKTYIEMKWFDEWTNQIYPIRLRPHQRFNLDARMFLPG